MAILSITNVSDAPVYVNDLYATVPANAVSPTLVSRPATTISAMAGLHAAVAAGKLTVTVAYTEDEIHSGLSGAAGQAQPSAVSSEESATMPNPVSAMHIELLDGETMQEYSIGIPHYSLLDATAVISSAGSGQIVLLDSASEQIGLLDDAAGVNRLIGYSGTNYLPLAVGPTLYIQKTSGAVGTLIVMFTREQVPA